MPGIDFKFSQYIQDNVQEALSGVKGENAVKIVGRNLATMERLAADILQQMQKVKGITDLAIFHVLGQPNLDIKIDRAKAARYGLNTGDVNTVIQAALGGAQATTLLEGDRQFGVVVRLPAQYRTNISAIRNIKVGYQTPRGINAYVPLSELADISLDTGASYIYHEARERYIPVKFSVRGRDLGGAVAEAQQRIAENVKLPPGYRLVWAGEFENMERAKARLAVIVPISLLLIFVLLYTLFNSMRDSLMALAGIPFAAGGGVLALYLSGQNFSISAAVELIWFGVSVMNGILIMTYYNEVRATGLNAIEAMFQAASQRMRPLLMTALSACIGLLPAAISSGIGSQVQRPGHSCGRRYVCRPDYSSHCRTGAADDVARSCGPCGGWRAPGDAARERGWIRWRIGLATDLSVPGCGDSVMGRRVDSRLCAAIPFWKHTGFASSSGAE